MRKRMGPEFGRMLRSGFVLAAVWPGLAAPSHAQSPCAPENWKMSALGYDDLSGRVHGAVAYRTTESGTGQVCVLVLWRGESGWFVHRERAREALRTRGLLMEPGPMEDRAAHPESVEPFPGAPGPTYSSDLGDVYIGFDYDWDRHRLRVLGQEIELGPSNVVLIDRADGVGGTPSIASILTIDPTIASGEVDLAGLVSRSEVVQGFVRE